MKLFESDQLKMINRTFPITFTEDEFRLEEDLTYKRLYKRLNSLKDIDLTNSYYLIHVKYRDYFRDRQNEYQAKLYDILHDVCENRGIDLRKYLKDLTKKKKTFDIYVIIFCLFSFIFLKNVIPLQIGIAVTMLLIIWKWEKVTIFLAKRLKLKAIHIQQYQEVPYILLITAVISLILDMRKYNSLLYLLCGYLFVLIVHIFSFLGFEKNVYKELEEDKVKKTKLTVRIYSLVVLILIILGLIRPVMDYIGTIFNTNTIMYFEGICTDTKDKAFGYKQITVNGITVKINSDIRDIKVGDYFKIEYGKYTHAVTNITHKDILSRFKDESSSDSETVNIMDEYLQTLNELDVEESKNNKK